MAMIWLSVKREFFIEFPFKSNNLEILLLTHIKGWGDYRITGRFKNEVIYGKRFTTHDLMKATCFDYIEVFYNRRRLHSSLGYQSPMQYLKDWLAKGKEKLVA
jgi:transposase InsO family protein